MKINVNKIARKVVVDNRIPFLYYYKIADNLLGQANVQREEKNILDYLVSETIPFHRDYQVLLPKERVVYNKLNKAYDRIQLRELDGPERISYGSEPSSSECPSYSNTSVKQPSGVARQLSWKYNNNHTRIYLFTTSQQETSSRHSFLGPYGLWGQWQGCAEIKIKNIGKTCKYALADPPNYLIKVQYPTYTDLISSENLSRDQAAEYGTEAVKDSDFESLGSTMESVLSLDDGRWSRTVEESSPALINEAREDPFQFVGIRQTSPPPVLAQVHDFSPIHPLKVTDPRPGPAKSSQDGIPSSNSYQHLRITHPSQICFMSSVDLHAHYSYQIMLPEAIAIVMAPTHASSPHGIFHLSDPDVMSVIRNCQQRGFILMRSLRMEAQFMSTVLTSI
ncbi:hypothetical protein P3X46_027899 [Hevea brasiliensis]|uniref:Uncharacterized protein n=1 Tax=Hevea brasiliensis TaxID=3981 RepID=A0ABQ9L2D9_HEVBR|nr:hypothetical protein P3X46_027899 [Hevea brasiliensis]